MILNENPIELNRMLQNLIKTGTKIKDQTKIFWNITANKTKNDKKAQLTQGFSKMAVSRHLGYYRTGNSAIRSADHRKP